MRILFTFVGGRGHYEPLVPIAKAAANAGHVVAVAGRPALGATIAADGFAAFGIGLRTAEMPQRVPLQPVSLEREEQVLRQGFADWQARQRTGELTALCTQWQPDVIVCDEVDFGAMMAAECYGLPHASVLVAAAGSFIRHGLIAEPLGRIRADYNLPADPELAMLSRYLVLAPFPPSFRDPLFAPPATAHSIRPAAFDAPRDDAMATWLSRLPRQPTVYFTLGTVFNVESGDLFDRVLAGLRTLPVTVIATTGPGIDPSEFGPQPDHMRLESYVAQAAILPHCAAVVSHGGSGSLMGALAHGLPSVLLPMGADQPQNASRSVELGIAESLDVITATPEAIAGAVAMVLAESRYRGAAQRLRDESARLPGAEYAVGLLERLAAQRRPLYSESVASESAET